MEKKLNVGESYLVFGKAGFFQNSPQITHPEIESLKLEKPDGKNLLEPVYPCTEKLKARGLASGQIAKLTATLLGIVRERDFPENIPETILKEGSFIPRFQAVHDIHFPPSQGESTVITYLLRHSLWVFALPA